MIYFAYLSLIRTFVPAKASESSAVGSALRSGRRGREFESPLSDWDETRGRGVSAKDYSLPFNVG